MSTICPSCGGTPGNLFFAGVKCSCGGILEDIDEDILRALLPFVPVSEDEERRRNRWGWLVKSVGMTNMQRIASMSPVDRIRTLDTLRKEAVKNGVQGALYSGADFNATEGEEFIRGSS